MSTTANERQIARNTMFLYLRIIISIALSLYTSRVVLEVLGIRDYGVYNVVGGLIVIISFLNSTMSGATQRFLNYEMGRSEGDLPGTFAAAFSIHMTLAAVVLVLGETVGLWFVNNYLVISPERMTAANWVYQFSLFSMILSVMTVPFIGAIFAHEKMNVYAIITLLFSFLKLGAILLVLFFAAFDNLIIYSALMFVVSLIYSLAFVIYCRRKFPESVFSFRAPKSVVKSLLKYSGSDLIGTSCYTLQTQGVLIILNRVGGTVLNAAGGLTTTVALSINQFGSTLIMASRPQIIKQYAAGDFAFMQRLMINCAKYSIILLSIFAIPIFIEIDFVLGLWLTEVPKYTAGFCQLTLLSSISLMAVTTLNCGIHATGRIFSFSVITGFTYLIELPIMYGLIVLTGNPAWVYILPIFQLTFNIGLISVMLKNRMPEFGIVRYVAKGVIAPALITLFCGLLSYFVFSITPAGWISFICVGFVSTISLCLLSWILLLDKDMRKEVLSTLKSKLHVGNVKE